MLRSVLVIAALLFARGALACSCGIIDPEVLRERSKVIVEGKVISVTEAPSSIAGHNRARIQVTKVLKGKASKVVVILTPNHSQTCRYVFERGQRGEFRANIESGKLSTNSCLMIGAKRD